MNFLYVEDEKTIKELKANGFTFLNKNGKVATFLNDGKLQFSDDIKKKVVFSKKLVV